MISRQYIYLVILTAMLGLTAPAVQAQEATGDQRQVYAQAESDYESGRLDQSLQLLKEHIDGFQGNLRQNAYRLMALCCLAQDDIKASETYALLLLRENPYYTPVQDPVRFEEMILRLKSGQNTTITTASSQAERIEEVPVPVTIITKEMIASLGYGKNLNQILAIFVPGMTEVASASMDNIAMRGVYTSGQEKILVMENGHRLNIRATNNGKMDYSISTEKIERIEVLRGPASSLYGNVALTAVVNIITRKGAEVGGVTAKYGGGTFHTHRADLLAGTEFMGIDIMAWASIYTSEGQKRYYNVQEGYAQSPIPGNALIDKYSGPPSHDVGLTMSLGRFDLMMSHKQGKKVGQYSHYGQLYDYDRYRTFNGLMPGYDVTSTHAEINYHTSLGPVALSVGAYGDWYSTTDYSVVSDSTITYAFNYDGELALDDDGKPWLREYWGLSQNYNWREHTLGGIVKADADYHIGSMKGNVLVGGTFEHFVMDNSYSLMGEDYDYITFVLPESKNYLQNGHENTVSAFVQDKHYFNPKFIVNAGMRFDIKRRNNDTRLTAISPRLAFVYMPRQDLSVRLCYARAFVDAPYFYRQNKSNTYRGSEDLMPEYMNAIQLNVLGSLPRIHLNYDVNLFYNHLTDIINNQQNTQATTVKYRNSGHLKIMGAEAGLNYSHKRLRGHLTLSCMHVIEAEDYYYSDHQIYAIPNLTANLNLSYKVLDRPQHELWIHGNMHVNSQALISANKNVSGSEPFYLSGKAVEDLSLVYRLHQQAQVSVECNNVFNVDCYIGGTTYFPYQKKGRNFMATVAYTF